MQSRACSGFAEPQPTLAIVISITSAKLQKIPETTKLFGDFFQRKKCAKGNLFLYGREFRPLLTSPDSGEEFWALGIPLQEGLGVVCQYFSIAIERTDFCRQGV